MAQRSRRTLWVGLLLAAVMFGLGVGLVIVSFASTLGALLAFLAARYLLRDAVQSRFGKQLAPVNDGMRRDGMLYLLTLRLVPVFPFFLVNLLAGTVVYVNVGTQLATIQRPADVLSPGLLASFVVLGVFPLIAKAVVEALKRRQVYAAWTRPKRFDRNLIVIGAGAGGLVTAYIGATLAEANKYAAGEWKRAHAPQRLLAWAERFHTWERT